MTRKKNPGYPPYWKQVKQGVDALGGKATYRQLSDKILELYPRSDTQLIEATIVLCSVNNPDRTKLVFVQNQAARITWKDPVQGRPGGKNERHDFLFWDGNYRVSVYDPKTHGVWEIYAQSGKFKVRKIQSGL